MFGQIIDKMTHIDQVDMYGMDAWTETMFNTLQTLMDTSNARLYYSYVYLLVTGFINLSMVKPIYKNDLQQSENIIFI